MAHHSGHGSTMILERRFDLKGSPVTSDELHLNPTCKTQLPSSPKFANSHFVTLAHPHAAEAFIASLCHYRRQKRGGKIFPRPILVTQPLPHTLAATGVHPSIREAEESEEGGSLAKQALGTDTVMFLFPFPKNDITHAPRYHLILPLANKENLDKQLAHKLSIFRHYILSFQGGQKWNILIDQCLSVRGGFTLKGTRALVQRASALMETHIGITLFLHHSSQTQLALQPHNMKSVAYLACVSHPDETPLTLLCTTCLAQCGVSECTTPFSCPNATCDSHQRGGWSLEVSPPQSSPALRRPHSAHPQPPRVLPSGLDFSPTFRSNPGRQQDPQQVAALPASEGSMHSLGNVCQSRRQASQDKHAQQEGVFDGLICDLTGRLDKIEQRTETLETSHGGFPPLESADQGAPAQGHHPKWNLTQKGWDAWVKKVSLLQADIQRNTDRLDQMGKLCRQQQLATEKSIARLEDLVHSPPPVVDIRSTGTTPPVSPPTGATTPVDALQSPSGSPSFQAQPGKIQPEVTKG